MIEHNEPLTTAWLTYRLYLSEISRHERGAAKYKECSSHDWLRHSEQYASLARYRAAKWLIRFMRLAKQAGGFVYVDRFVYVETGG